jgi:hypothetical protein
MNINLRSTTRIVEANGIQCRVWEGTTGTGLEVFALIPRIACHDETHVAFELELEAFPPVAPSDRAAHYVPDRCAVQHLDLSPESTTHVRTAPPKGVAQ